MATTWADLFAQLGGNPNQGFWQGLGSSPSQSSFNFGGAQPGPGYFDFSTTAPVANNHPFEFGTLNAQRANQGGVLNTLQDAYKLLFTKKNQGQATAANPSSQQARDQRNINAQNSDNPRNPAAQQTPYMSSTGNADGSGSGTQTDSGASVDPQALAKYQTDSANRRTFVNSLMPVAKAYEATTGIPADTWLAMAASESNWGNAPGNELFGIKGPGEVLNTWEDEGGKRVNTSDSFRSYANPASAFQDFWNFLHDNSRYAPALQAFDKSGHTDWQGLLQGINQAGYATNPNWWQSIIGIKNNSIDPLVNG